MSGLFQRLIIGSTICAVTACVNVPYRIPVQQGNVIEPARAKLIKQGMTREQVAGIAGTPLLQSIFHQNRWDYVYRLDEHYKPALQTRMSVWFSGDTVSHIDRVEEIIQN